MKFQAVWKAMSIVAALVVTVPIGARAEAPEFRDDFEGVTLDASWTVLDGYAVARPDDAASHAKVGLKGSQLIIDIPSGRAHNQWVLEHTAVTRAYEGSGVYEVALDGPIGEGHQLGMVFESSPGTFVMFMLYGRWHLWGYIEQFSLVNGVQNRTIHPNEGNGYTDLSHVPQDGPFYLRTTIRDDADPTTRHWKFEWSKDGSNWLLVHEGAVETRHSTENIGVIRTVGLFAGSHAEENTPFSAPFDYFQSSAESKGR